MLMDLPRVTSARAADIVGVGYEGFRAYLKRGLLGRVGMLPGFHRGDRATSDDPAPRNKWMTFGFADLCLMRIAKLLMDAGYTFTAANAAVSQHEIWSKIQHDEAPQERFLLMWGQYGDHIVFDTADLQHLPSRLAEVEARGAFVLLNLGDVQRHVAELLTVSQAPATNRTTTAS